MSEKIFHPTASDGHYKLGIILFNHAGSSVAQDTGRDARYLADYLRVPVIAADRPGSAGHLPSKLMQHRLGLDYVGTIHRLQEPIEDLCITNNISRLILTGRSAGALGAVAFGAGFTMRSTTLSGIYAAEMAGSGIAGHNGRAARREARRAYADYRRRQSDAFNANAALVRPDPTDTHGLTYIGRALSIAASLPADFYNNDHIWGSRLGIDCALKVAQSHPHAHLQFEYANKESAVATPESIQQFRDRLHTARHANEGATAEVYQPARTLHASFDKREYFAERLGQVVDYVGFS